MIGPQFKFIEVATSDNAIAERVDPKNGGKIY